ncbi:ATP-binding cassette domain-containing protein [Thermostaphylospora chromogena]|mgnify:CR=1 FL=1|uniref:ABC-2 type transport system ATP-binding protein n=1 Tax=Thermostaphylospora chromogena TaxID=35622 RepID=A0A1H1EW49_9ACTN|nr:ATP-binding cassette domain-containing protein [Thermostaphylospora chromogena]SDQ92903.1 ABC-2 type transport system ATP-binding protein [Thermostaphylospora chromogena]
MIHTRGLTRRFMIKKETVEAVRGLDIDVEEGELVAFLGPNGAGKSTSLRMLTTLLPPTSGTAVVAGHDVVTDPAGVRRRIGYIGQGSGAGDNFRVVDELVTQGRCYGLGRAAARERAAELLAVLDLEPLATRTAATLSGGQRRRLDIALGLVHRPGLLFLDEPSTGLDPHNRADLWEHILRLRKENGTTIVMTTHYLDEADAMAERVMIIDHGRIIADDAPEKLKADLAGDLVTVVLDGEASAVRAAEVAGRIPHVREVTAEGAVVTLRAPGGPAVLPELLRTLEADGVRVSAAEVRRPTLDDVFLSLTGRSLRETDIARTEGA